MSDKDFLVVKLSWHGFALKILGSSYANSVMIFIIIHLDPWRTL